jgi:hypothetical protein
LPPLGMTLGYRTGSPGRLPTEAATVGISWFATL